ncbi:hypothetical protein EJB05_47366 [Eragrostis curvula]|uniref:At1g61320/AtMIF1 LRR domain-containing protein n=1 Tax=Eragrostis curvula TaxID=38414 RepID=A0A5J9T7G1_9POAL|nr:hypothetical protein EJB05_47366 [Eragrostis curvula]
MDPTSPPPDPPLLGAEDDFIQPRNMRIQCNDQQLVQNPDMISALPDDILIQMLSLMTVREAAMTDCLSTRWRHLWENLENLILDSRAFGMQLPENLNYRENPELWNSETTRFVNKVNEVLCHHNGSRVKKFVVQFPLTSAHASEIDRWVAFAAASQAESLLVGLSNKLGTGATENSELYNFPLKHFADMRGCRLRELYLCKCSLETVPTKLNGFSCLATLFLNRVQVVDEVLLNITSSLCAFRFLRLKRCNKLINLRISHAKLVVMDVYRCWGLFNISIHAEKLEYLSYEGNEVFIKYECAPILRELHALFKVDNQFPVDFMGEFPNLEILTLQFPSRLYVCISLTTPLWKVCRFEGNYFVSIDILEKEHSISGLSP